MPAVFREKEIESYQLTIRIPIVEAFDDPMARQKATAITNLILSDDFLPAGTTFKLQKTFKNAPPEAVSLT